MRPLPGLLVLLVLLAPSASALDVALRTLRVVDGDAGEGSVDALGFTGAGVVVAVLDTGVQDAHPAFAGAFLAGVDVSHPCNALAPDDVSCYAEQDPPDRQGHGTHVAGILLGRPNDLGPRGVAPGARLVDVKIGLDLTSSTPGLHRGLLWVKAYNERHPPGDPARVRVVSLSAGSAEPGDPDDAASRAVDALVASGVVVVVAAGNCGAGQPPCVKGGPGTLSSPGVARGAVTVAALDDRRTVPADDDAVAAWSSRGAGDGDGKPDVAAPGTAIRAPWYSPLTPGHHAYAPNTGTSMATPLVAGVAALVLEANPDLTPEEVKDVLQSTARPLGEAPHDPGYGHGLVDALAAVEEALRRTGEPPVPRFEGPTRALDGLVVAFDATASTDAEGPIASYRWDFGAGGTAVGPIVAKTFAPGRYEVTLTVVDGHGRLASLARPLVVEEATRVARLAVAPENGTTETRFAFDGTASEGAGGVVAHAWDFGDGGTATGPRVEHVFAAPGEYAVTLRTRDASGRESVAERVVRVDPPPFDVALSFAPSPAEEGRPVALDASATVVPGGFAHADWDFGDGSPVVRTAAPLVRHAYARPGAYEASVTVASAWGHASSATVALHVLPPPPRAAFTLDRDAVLVGEAVAFLAAPTEGAVLTWSFGDGGTARGPSASHAWGAPGAYRVVLTATDAHGRQDAAELLVRVDAPAGWAPAPEDAAPGGGPGAASAEAGPRETPALGLALLVAAVLLALRRR